jgi:hypothetical protein
MTSATPASVAITFRTPRISDSSALNSSTWAEISRPKADRVRPTCSPRPGAITGSSVEG